MSPVMGEVEKVLILGGTAEARALAAALTEAGVQVESSLAGRVANPRLPVGRVRVGGFGGADGLAAYLRSEPVDVVVDATHPFARTMSANAVAACAAADTPLLRFARPGWGDDPRAGDWHWADDYAQARQIAEQFGGVPFLTTGRQTLTHFTPWAARPVLVRVVEPLADAPVAWTVLRDRGPYTLQGERALFAEHRVSVLLSKDSGGSYTAAKLTAAAETGVPVVLVRRPPVLAALAVSDLAEVLQTLGLGADTTREPVVGGRTDPS